MTKLNNTVFIYSFLFVYFIFSHIHPFIHFHSHQSENQLNVHFCFHPIGVECPTETEGCKHHHEQNECHVHCFANLNHILLANNKTASGIYQDFLFPSEQLILSQLYISGSITDSPKLLRSREAISILPARSPPFLLL